MACHECDLLHRIHPLKYGERAKCSRCGAGLWAKKQDSFERTIMFAVTSLILLVLAASILFPFLKIIGMLYVLVPLEFNRRPWKAPQVFRVVAQFQTWAMMDVYLLGVIVAVIKLADLATLVPGVAIYSFGALILTLAAADSALDPHAVWEKMEHLR